MAGEQDPAVTVELDQLRAFAKFLGDLSPTVGGMRIDDALAGAGGALPGTDFAQVVARAQNSANTAFGKIAGRMSALADAANRSVSSYDRADAEFEAKLTGLDSTPGVEVA